MYLLEVTLSTFGALSTQTWGATQRAPKYSISMYLTKVIIMKSSAVHIYVIISVLYS